MSEIYFFYFLKLKQCLYLFIFHFLLPLSLHPIPFSLLFLSNSEFGGLLPKFRSRVVVIINFADGRVPLADAKNVRNSFSRPFFSLVPLKPRIR
ncbi:Uncharacterized protein TCM_035436 [Theobroma cacao]|uniref:Uncharacterized protein n=1 Tax=Theobroma cacao TaxID=3641 RepID=A0A061FIX3_THECC|nr:Uncharacterized protein TCM_035436 [Theobroma cacao]